MLLIFFQSRYGRFTPLSKTLQEDPSCQLCTVLQKYLLQSTTNIEDNLHEPDLPHLSTLRQASVMPQPQSTVQSNCTLKSFREESFWVVLIFSDSYVFLCAESESDLDLLLSFAMFKTLYRKIIFTVAQPIGDGGGGQNLSFMIPVRSLKTY